MFSNQNDEVLTETTFPYTVENTDYRIVVREMQRPDESIYFQVMVIDPDDKETDWIGPWPNQTKARYEGCKWAEDIYAEAQHDYAPDPDDEPTDRERAWNWIESKSRFTDPSGSYAWLWEGLDDSDLMHYSEWSVEDALSVQAPWIWDRLLADYETKTGEPCPLSQDDYAEFLTRSDYADAIQAYKDRVLEVKKALLSDCFERFMANAEEVERAIDLATHQHDFGDVTARIELFVDQTWRILPLVGNLYNSAGILIAPGCLEDSDRATDDVSANYDNAIEVTRRSFEMIWE